MNSSLSTYLICKQMFFYFFLLITSFLGREYWTCSRRMLTNHADALLLVVRGVDWTVGSVTTLQLPD